MKESSKRTMRLCFYLLVGAAALVTAAVLIKPSLTRAATNGIVPIELVLLVDTSGSVDEAEYMIQRDGYAAAFRDEGVTRQIEDVGGIAVVYIEWDAATNQSVRVPWTLLRDRSDCLDFATHVQALERRTSGTTMLAPALEFARNELLTNFFMGLRRVIDVSGDGLCKNWNYYEHGVIDEEHTEPAHYGTPWNEVIDSLRTSVHAVNGVFIGATSEHLAFYEETLPLGPDAFSMHAESFTRFGETLEQKLMRELTVSIPGSYD